MQNTKTVFLNETELAERHQRSVKTLQAERLKGTGVPFVKLGRNVRYRLTDIESWEQAHLVHSTSEVR